MACAREGYITQLFPASLRRCGASSKNAGGEGCGFVTAQSLPVCFCWLYFHESHIFATRCRESLPVGGRYLILILHSWCQKPHKQNHTSFQVQSPSTDAHDQTNPITNPIHHSVWRQSLTIRTPYLKSYTIAELRNPSQHRTNQTSHRPITHC